MDYISNNLDEINLFTKREFRFEIYKISASNISKIQLMMYNVNHAIGIIFRLKIY